MNEIQLSSLRETPEEIKNFSLKDLKNQSERTLIYGYTVKRETFHIYIKEHEIHKYIYDYEENLILYKSGRFQSHEFIPSKRIYPSASDFEFCEFLIKLGCSLPFTTMEDRPAKQYHGEIAKHADILKLRNTV
jgi:hypothetical protein